VASVEKRPAPELGRIAVSEWAETWLASKKMPEAIRHGHLWRWPRRASL
jgi:hypothetical protein